MTLTCSYICAFVVVVLGSFISADAHRKHHDSADYKGSNSLFHSSKGDNCCLNGGICIANTFCNCPEPYYGRYCEKDVRHMSCGTIRHGTCMASGCHLCHCFDGNMRCKATAIPGCEKQKYVEGYESNPNYLVDLDSRIPNADNFYQENEYNESNVTSGSDYVTWTMTMVLACVLFSSQ